MQEPHEEIEFLKQRWYDAEFGAWRLRSKLEEKQDELNAVRMKYLRMQSDFEADRMKDSDRIAELEEEIYELKNNRIVLKDDCVPNMLRHTDQKIKKSPAGTDE